MEIYYAGSFNFLAVKPHLLDGAFFVLLFYPILLNTRLGVNACRPSVPRIFAGAACCAPTFYCLVYILLMDNLEPVGAQHAVPVWA